MIGKELGVVRDTGKKCVDMSRIAALTSAPRRIRLAVKLVKGRPFCPGNPVLHYASIHKLTH
jgi:hypothetical protein